VVIDTRSGCTTTTLTSGAMPCDGPPFDFPQPVSIGMTMEIPAMRMSPVLQVLRIQHLFKVSLIPVALYV
jgi:hypothetical protein